MPPETIADARYPIGPSPMPGAPITKAEREDAIITLAGFPQMLRNAVGGLNHHELDTPYRDGGWTIRQLVHHLGDSHPTALFRYRLALTAPATGEQAWPAILAYPEDRFAQLHDYLAAPIEWSLEIVEATHARWVMLLQSMTDEQWQRGFVHPQRGRLTLEANLLLYQWHCLHHLAHITHLRHDKGW